jgi:predicted O-linked N-acetylglucosamine transferase (SPINDLY family)
MTEVEKAKALFFEALDLLDAKDFGAAETRLREALRIVPDRVSALTNLSVALLSQDKTDEAVATAQRAVDLAPDNVEGWLALGSSLSKQKQLDPALVAMQRAVELAPASAIAWKGQATVLIELKAYDRAVSALEKAARIDPAEEDVRALLVSAKMQACDWQGLMEETNALLQDIRSGATVSNPFMVLAMPATAADQLTAAARYAARDYPLRSPLYRGERYQHSRVRIAYVSGDFRQHPLAHLMVGVFENHDRNRFDVIGVSYGPDDRSAIRERVATSFESFIDVAGQSDDSVAEYLRNAAVDIAVDLGGFTTGGRPRIFARRPAGIQVSFLGYPGTSGTPYLDYIVADPVVIPPEDRHHYSEKVVTLPDSYFPNDRKRRIAEEIPARSAVGLPERAVVFCCFNNSYKITAGMFDIWMKLLRAVDGSVLWLLQSNPTAVENLKREASARGVASERLVFAPYASIDDHLARHRLADIFLDTRHYNAHTTACDALWAGLPVVTLTGETFASRVATSLLHAVGMPEFATSSVEEYERLALDLASNPANVSAAKEKLARNRMSTALFDTARFTRYLEAAYMAMVDRHRRSQGPDHISVQRFV